MAIQWSTYLTVDGKPLREASESELDELERVFGNKLPDDFKELVKKHQGQNPDNFKVILPKGSKPGFTCILHASDNDPDLKQVRGYSIEFMTTMAEEEGEHENIVVFAHSGNSGYALDYNNDPENPEVVFIDGDFEADDERSKKPLAKSITEFLEKFETPES